MYDTSTFSLGYVDRFLYGRTYGPGIHQKTIALGRLMQATGIARFFFIYDMEMFLQRLALVHAAFKDNIPTPDEALFAFDHEGEQMDFTLEDLKLHIGFEASGEAFNSTRMFFASFYRNPRQWSQAADILGFDKKDFKGSEAENAWMEADKYAESVIKKIDDEAFWDMQGGIDYYVEDLWARQDALAGWVFDVELLPDTVIDQLKQRVLGEKDGLEHADPSDMKMVCDAAYLAWLWANDHIELVTDDEGLAVDAYVKDYVDFSE